jgi:hypothetical protein
VDRFCVLLLVAPVLWRCSAWVNTLQVRMPCHDDDDDDDDDDDAVPLLPAVTTGCRETWLGGASR